MAKVDFGEFSAFETKGGVRFMKNGKMTSDKLLPPEVVEYLTSKLVPKDTGKFPMPTEEEKARMRAESLKVPDHLKIDDGAVAATEDEILARPIEDTPVEDTPVEEPITAADFDAPDTPGATDGIVGEEAAREELKHQETVTDPSFLESVSIHTATLQDITQALYERFGIYTVYLNMLPNGDEVNPVTGETFTKYHHGIAYQSAIQAHNRGLADPEGLRARMDSTRLGNDNFQDAMVEAPRTLKDARDQNSFAYRTSSQGAEVAPATRIEHVTDPNTGEVTAVQVEVPQTERGGVAPSKWNEEEGEQVLEPPIFNTKPIIRPDW